MIVDKNYLDFFAGFVSDSKLCPVYPVTNMPAFDANAFAAALACTMAVLSFVVKGGVVSVVRVVVASAPSRAGRKPVSNS